jgi:hypothetical protein
MTVLVLVVPAFTIILLLFLVDFPNVRVDLAKDEEDQLVCGLEGAWARTSSGLLITDVLEYRTRYSQVCPPYLAAKVESRRFVELVFTWTTLVLHLGHGATQLAKLLERASFVRNCPSMTTGFML